MSVLKKEIEPTYKKENGLFVIDVEKIEKPKQFKVKETTVVYIPPEQFGGNHKHPRWEAFIGFGDLEITWIDKKGKKRVEKMGGEKLQMFIVEPMTSHVVKNFSKNHFAMFIEFASEKQHDVQRVEVI